ncbi:dienelactone hydrolase family protein [Aquiflexum sp. TKW24L]|uniref:alpha/beta hydrolase n=1 Tax=Aquiflexum sp. TKW24L TaxID=2942212 RepID=UPI0020C04B47|nr:dienelactone hydrolase family protein [Aquiflexum sp. TKW24L]MCL6260136.1 dienelactone hydrolase family protein [Aquiflexum sp. TKW24L]
MKKSILLNLILSVSYCFFFFTSTFGQETKEDTNTNLPVVSNEVFESIVQFYKYDQNIPLEARIVEKKELPDGNREKIIFKGVNNSTVPAYLTIPKNGATSHPVVVIADGIYGSKERWFEDDSWPKGGLITKSFLRAGFAVLILDAAYHGERTSEYDYVSPPFPLTFPNEARHMVIQTATEYRRAIDYLSTRSEIDTSRIGMMGLSMGAVITFQLSSIDPRIKTAVAGLTPPLKLPELQAGDVCTFANHVSCNSFLMFMGNEDPFYSMEEAHELYDRIPISQKEFVEYNVGHEPPAEYVEKVTDWFEKHLK